MAYLLSVLGITTSARNSSLEMDGGTIVCFVTRSLPRMPAFLASRHPAPQIAQWNVRSSIMQPEALVKLPLSRHRVLGADCVSLAEHLQLIFVPALDPLQYS